MTQLLILPSQRPVFNLWQRVFKSKAQHKSKADIHKYYIPDIKLVGIAGHSGKHKMPLENNGIPPHLVVLEIGELCLIDHKIRP